MIGYRYSVVGVPSLLMGNECWVVVDWAIDVGSCLMGHRSSVLGIGVESWMMVRVMSDGAWVTGMGVGTWVMDHGFWLLGYVRCGMGHW